MYIQGVNFSSYFRFGGCFSLIDRLCASGSFLFSPPPSFCRKSVFLAMCYFLFCLKYLKIFLCIFVKMFSGIGKTLLKEAVLASISVFSMCSKER